MKDDFEEIIDCFARTTDEIVSLEEFRQLLKSGKQLRIKYGVDVTAPYLHIGHAVNLWMMRKLQDMGHKVVFLIGDFTTRIGDPTGKNKTRPVIPLEEIERNTELFIEQVKMVLRFDNPELLEIRRNSEWFGRMSVADFLALLSMITHSKLISRDMFQRRLESNDEIYMHEMIYPILQGYDSYELQSDLTIIGSDQLFNEMLGRFYQERHGQRPQVIITSKITPGIDGKAKQSKSLNNYIGLGHSPRDKFGRVMSLPDHLILDYFKVYTDVEKESLMEIESLLPNYAMDMKKRLAQEIVRRYHGEAVAEEEKDFFEKTFSNKETPQDIPEIKLPGGQLTPLQLLQTLFGDGKSNSELRRLIQQGSVKLNSSKISESAELPELKTGDIVKVGKRIWFKLKL